jgi:hypothetical protein
MRHGRAFACGCPGDHLELHWHMRSSNLLYSYAVHLTADAGAVVHQCPEIGYQYNGVPNTEHFGRTIMISRMLSTEGKLLQNETCAVPTDACVYCDVSFKSLW